MTVKELLMKKANSLPNELASEVIDFIEFLNAKKRKNNSINIAEEGMNEYLHNLEIYEDLLAKGKIKWK